MIAVKVNYHEYDRRTQRKVGEHSAFLKKTYETEQDAWDDLLEMWTDGKMVDNERTMHTFDMVDTSVTRLYRVTWDILQNKRYHARERIVEARNATEAKYMVMDEYEKGRIPYRFHCEAHRIK